MPSYQLIRAGRLFATKASLGDRGGIKILTLLVDTGSTYTIIPVEALEGIGQSPAASKEHVRIVTGSGILIAPMVTIRAFHCLGKSLQDFAVVGHSLPPAGPIDGLLGMDFLTAAHVRIDVATGTLETRE